MAQDNNEAGTNPETIKPAVVAEVSVELYPFSEYEFGKVERTTVTPAVTEGDNQSAEKIETSVVSFVKKDGDKFVAEEVLSDLEAATLYGKARTVFEASVANWEKEVKTVKDAVDERVKALGDNKRENDEDKTAAAKEEALIAQLNKWVAEKSVALAQAKNLLAAADADPSYGMVDELDAEGKALPEVNGKKPQVLAWVALGQQAERAEDKAEADYKKANEAVENAKPYERKKVEVKAFDQKGAFEMATLMARANDILNFDFTAEERLAHADEKAPLNLTNLVLEGDEVQTEVRNFEAFQKMNARLALEANSAKGHASKSLRIAGISALSLVAVSMAVVAGVTVTALFAPQLAIPAMLAWANAFNVIGAVAALTTLSTTLATVVTAGTAGVVATAGGAMLFKSKATGPSAAAKGFVNAQSKDKKAEEAPASEGEKNDTAPDGQKSDTAPEGMMGPDATQKSEVADGKDAPHEDVEDKGRSMGV